MINVPSEFYSDELGNLSRTPNYAQDPIVPKRNQVFGTIEHIGKTWKVSFDILPTGENRNSGYTSVFRITQKESDLPQFSISFWFNDDGKKAIERITV